MSKTLLPLLNGMRGNKFHGKGGHNKKLIILNGY
jgi:hypothetical protein